VADKTRRGDREVEIRLPDLDFGGRTVVLVDDVVSSGHTLATAAGILKSQGASHVHCLITHPLFSNRSAERLTGANIEKIWSTDSIVHATNVIQLAPLLGDAVLGRLEEASLM
jgi:ribose-phosphate pyrophosphokinase